MEVILFSEIEKEYKKGLQERRFFRYYWPRAIILIAIALALDFGININRWLVYGVMVVLLIFFIIMFFVRDYQRGVRNVGAEKVRQTSRNKRFKLLMKADDEIRISNLITDLRKHNLRTKADIEITMTYFERNRPVASKPNLLEWTLSIAVALSSIVVLAYDEQTGMIDGSKFLSTFGSTMVIAQVFLMPAILAKIISARIASARTKVDSFLVEDLAFIYVNYEHFRKYLEK